MILQREATHDPHLFERGDRLDFFGCEPADVEHFLDLGRKLTARSETAHPEELGDRRESEALSFKINIKGSRQRGGVVVIEKGWRRAYRFHVKPSLFLHFTNSRRVKRVPGLYVATRGNPLVEAAVVDQKDTIVLNEIARTHQRKPKSLGSAAACDLDRVRCFSHCPLFYGPQPESGDVK